MKFFWYEKADSSVTIVWVESEKLGDYKAGQFVIVFMSDWHFDCREFITHYSSKEFLEALSSLNPITDIADFLEAHRSMINPKEYTLLVEKFI